MFVSSFAARAYIERTSSVLRDAMVSRFGGSAAENLANWQRAMQAILVAPAGERQTLVAVNNLANRVDYLSDQQNWGVPDYWATPAEFVSKGAGDCEDYVIAKYYALRTLGVDGNKLRLIYARAFFQGQLVPHMVLAWYRSPDAEPLLLDNIDPRLLPASQRPDLSPVYGFNEEGLWQGTSRNASAPITQVQMLSKWTDLQWRVKAEMQL